MLVNNLGVDNILMISRLLGHASVQETLKTYSHLWRGELEKMADKLNQL
jgi:integrase